MVLVKKIRRKSKWWPGLVGHVDHVRVGALQKARAAADGPPPLRPSGEWWGLSPAARQPRRQGLLEASLLPGAS